MVRDIFTFLERYQLINMGYLPLPPQPAHSAESPHVLIVGAGPAGVAAARALVSAGVKVTIYEVRDRVGGRVNSRKINTSTGPIVLDMGASIITGFGGGNPMAIIAQQVCFLGGSNPCFLGGSNPCFRGGVKPMLSWGSNLLRLSCSFTGQAQSARNAPGMPTVFHNGRASQPRPRSKGRRALYAVDGWYSFYFIFIFAFRLNR